MSDLISRSEMIKAIEEHYMNLTNDNVPRSIPDFYSEMQKLVYNQPTAFDTEKVVEQLEEVNMNYFLTIANTGSEKLDIAYGYASDSINKAINIVKKGGVE